MITISDILYMHRQYRYSEKCERRCIPEEGEDIFDHEDNFNVKHEYVRDKRVQEQVRSYQQVVRAGEGGVEEERQRMLGVLGRVREEIDRLEEYVNMVCKRSRGEYQIELFENQHDRRIMFHVKQKNFGQFSCKDMSRLLKITREQYLPHLLENSKNKLRQCLQQELKEFIRKVCNDNHIEIGEPDRRLERIKINESSISKLSNDSLASDGLIDLKADFEKYFIGEKPLSMAKKPSHHVVDCKNEEDEDSDSLEIIEEDGDTSYYQQSKQNFTKITIPANIINPVPAVKQEEKQEQERSERAKANTDKQSECSDQKSEQEENEEQIMKEIQETELKISNIKTEGSQQDNFMKIIDLQDIKVESPFNIRVKVVRVLYYSVIINNILKAKFIAGDETGIGVFFTNYSRIIKPGTELEMIYCNIKQFREFREIKNDRNFRVINADKGRIEVMLNGYIFSPGIEQDLYYRVYDKCCHLIREVAQRLQRKNHFTVSKMIVKVVIIINEWPGKLFCQVGDSSGLMLAYLKKEPVKKINEGDVVKLYKVTAKKGLQPNKIMREEIIYLDTLAEGTNITPFRQEFLEISQSIMTA